MRDQSIRDKLKNQYYQEWLKSGAPKPWDYKNKRAYKNAKKVYVQSNTDISKYLAKRFIHLLSKGSVDLAGMFSRFYNEDLQRGLASLLTPEPQDLRTGC